MYNYSYSYGYSPVISSGAAAAIGLGIIAVAVLMFIAWCRILIKGNRNWWGMFIPFYGSYLQYEVAGAPGLFWISLICTGVSTLMSSVSPEIGSFLTVATGIVSIVLYIIHCVKLSKAFGHGGGFAVGLIFLNPIFIMILGFGKSYYQG